MVSARRASDVHQKRTGRALCVTEAEVANEEMYEEVIDSPTDSLRLNARLQTGNEAFDRRLLAYLTSQVSMPGALQQAVPHGWQDEDINANTDFVSPGLLQSTPLPQQYLAGNVIMPPQMTNATPHVYRQSPYPLGPWAMQPGSSRHVSTGSTQGQPFTQQHVDSPNSVRLENGQWVSLPTSATPWQSQSPIMASTNSQKCPTTTLPRVDSAISHTDTHDSFQQSAINNKNQPNTQRQPMRTAIENHIEPLSITIPLESQQFLASNPYTPEFIKDSPSSISPRHDFTDHRYSYNPNGKTKPTPSPSNLSPGMTLSTSIPSSNSSLGQTPSPLWLDNNTNPRPSTSYDNAFT